MSLPTILETLVAEARERVSLQRQRVPYDELAARTSTEGRRSLLAALTDTNSAGRNAIIAEAKKASPSKGIFRNDFDHLRLARDYANGGAAAMSVVTEPQRFLGDINWIGAIREVFPGPVLRKDFVIDRYQIAETAAAGADAVLLIARILDDKSLRELGASARECGLEILFEAHDENDLSKIVASDPDLVGVNCRNLGDFSVDTDRPARLRELLPDSALAVAESGIESIADIERLSRCGYDAFLVGETLVRADDPAGTLRALVETDG